MTSAAMHANDPGSSSDRRLHSRQLIHSLAYAEIDDGNGGIVLNVSEGGMSIRAVMGLTEDVFPRLRFQLPQSRGWIETSARIAWMSKSRKVAGLQFVDLPEPTRTRLREWLFLETSPLAVQEAPREETAPFEQSHGVLPPTASPAAAPPVDESVPAAPAEPKLRETPPASPGIVDGPPPITAPPAGSASSSLVYTLRRSLSEASDSGDKLHETASRHATSPGQMLILACLFLVLAIISMVAGWVAGRGTFSGSASRSSATGPSSSGQRENAALPPVGPAAPVSEIQIVDANNQQWVIPFVPPGSGIERNPREQTQLNAAKQSPERPTLQASASSPAAHPSPTAANAISDGTKPPAPGASAPLSAPGHASPASGSSQPRSHVSSTRPAPSTGAPAGGVLQPGEMVSRVDPLYPESAQDRGIEGTVKLRVTIGADGAVRKMSVMGGPGPLVQAAEDAVGQWRYTPTLLDGKPVEAEEDVSIVFQLPSASQRSQ
jgi:TonB family protein